MPLVSGRQAHAALVGQGEGQQQQQQQSSRLQRDSDEPQGFLPASWARAASRGALALLTTCALGSGLPAFAENELELLANSKSTAELADGASSPPPRVSSCA